jgi:hypothetical protein
MTEPQVPEQPPEVQQVIDFESDAPMERPADGQACSLEPGCESCQ